MDGSINSDENMAAAKTFDLILNSIQHSCQNFRIEVSPFRTESDYNATCVAPTDQLSLSVGAECGN